jgi:hypothetical protein
MTRAPRRAGLAIFAAVAEDHHGMGPAPRRRLLVAVLAGVALMGIPTAALSAPATNATITFVSPSPSEGTPLKAGTVSFVFTISKKPKEIGSLTCTLSGPTATSGACDTATTSKTGSTSSKSYTGLANGSYTFSVLLALTNGKLASATRHFTVGPAHALTLTPVTGKGGARTGMEATYAEHLTNTGVDADSYSVSTSSPWTAQVYSASCSTPLSTTATLQPGASIDLCLKVTVPESAADGDRSDTTLTATSATDTAVTATSDLTTIAIQFDTLLVDEDTDAPIDSAPYYETALTTNGIDYSYWDLGADPTLPLSVLTSHTNVIWFTGNTSSGPLAPYESELASFLDNGGKLFMSGQDILDSSAGTTAFVHDYLHINWDSANTTNNKITSDVHGAAGNPVTDGVGAVPLDHSVLNATFEDEITPTTPATAAFTDDTAATDGLSVAAGVYKAVFLAFPFEAYGSAAQKSDLMSRALTWLDS